MTFSTILKREVEVAFSKHTQPIWYRVLKYIFLLSLLYLLWGSKWIWPVFGALFVLALSLHFWYRYKTKAWTKSYGFWNYDKKISSVEMPINE